MRKPHGKRNERLLTGMALHKLDGIRRLSFITAFKKMGWEDSCTLEKLNTRAGCKSIDEVGLRHRELSRSGWCFCCWNDGKHLRDLDTILALPCEGMIYTICELGISHFCELNR